MIEVFCLCPRCHHSIAQPLEYKTEERERICRAILDYPGLSDEEKRLVIGIIKNDPNLNPQPKQA